LSWCHCSHIFDKWKHLSFVDATYRRWI
jgi:hypothetical protein